jgi:hypothetical protein
LGDGADELHRANPRIKRRHYLQENVDTLLVALTQASSAGLVALDR